MDGCFSRVNVISLFLAKTIFCTSQHECWDFRTDGHLNVRSSDIMSLRTSGLSTFGWLDIRMSRHSWAYAGRPDTVSQPRTFLKMAKNVQSHRKTSEPKVSKNVSRKAAKLLTLCSKQPPLRPHSLNQPQLLLD